MKVYVATEGSYSDYRIKAVFVRREDAEKVGDVEEYELHESAPRGKRLHIATGVPTEDRDPKRQSQRLMPWDSLWEDANARRPRVFVHEKWGPYEVPPKVLTVRGGDESVVLKAWYDRAAQIRAEAEGVA